MSLHDIARQLVAGPCLAEHRHLAWPPSSIRLAINWPGLARAGRSKEWPVLQQQVESHDVDHVLRRELVEPCLLQLALQNQGKDERAC